MRASINLLIVDDLRRLAAALRELSPPQPTSKGEPAVPPAEKRSFHA